MITLLRRSAVLVALLLTFGCAPAEKPREETPAAEPDVAALAQTLARETLIVDTHIDVPYRLLEKPADVSQATEDGDFDFPRARKGGLDAAFMSIYVPASFEDNGAKAHAEKLIDMVEGFATDHADQFVLAMSSADVEAVLGTGKVALPMGMENGSPIEGDLENLRYFFDRGIRYITLTHSENNHLGNSSYATEDLWDGLSPFGREAVAEMNRLGIMVDVSHVDDPTLLDVLEVTQAPVIASHSSARHFTPGFERNVSDELIQKIAENGGVVQINFGSAFLTEEANAQSKARWAAQGAFQKEHGLEDGDPQLEEFSKTWREENPTIYADLSDVVDHIDHIVQLVGVDFVGLGSDFDGVGDSLPTGLKDVSAYPNLIRALLEKGYSEDDVRKICSGNLLRVWRKVEEVARELSETSEAA